MINIRTLLCHRDMISGMKCLSSAQTAICEEVSFEIFDDGTLTDDDISLTKKTLNNVRIITRRERESKVCEFLSKYPACTKFREMFPLGMKLFDCSLYEATDWLNYLDSDIYFLRRVSGLFSSNSFALFMKDVDNAYSLRIRSFFEAPPLVAKLNSGIIRFPTRAFDLELLEQALGTPKIFQDLEKTPVWAEQTCFSILAGSIESRLIHPDDALVVSKNFKPGDEGSAFAIHAVSSYRGVLSHYELHKQDLKTAPVRTIPTRKLSLFSSILTIATRWLTR